MPGQGTVRLMKAMIGAVRMLEADASKVINLAVRDTQSGRDSLDVSRAKMAESINGEFA